WSSPTSATSRIRGSSSRTPRSTSPNSTCSHRPRDPKPNHRRAASARKIQRNRTRERVQSASHHKEPRPEARPERLVKQLDGDAPESGVPIVPPLIRSESKDVGVTGRNGV